MSPETEEVLLQFRQMIELDGGSLEILETSNSTLVLKYVQGRDCASCAIDPESLGELIKEALLHHDQVMNSVTILLST